MKRKKRLSAEQIRYYVPGIKNRFFDVHKTIILACMLMVFVVVTFYAAYLSVTSAAESETRAVIVLFCEVDDIVSARKEAEVLRHTYEVHFAVYEEKLQSDDDEIPYDLSVFGANAQTWLVRNYNEDLFAVVVYVSRMSVMRITYSGLGIVPTVFTGEQVIQMLREAYNNIYQGV